MPLKESVENNVVVWLLGMLAAGFLSGLASYQLVVEIAGLKVVQSDRFEGLQGDRDALLTQVAALRIAGPLWCRVPADSNLLLRGIRVSVTKHASTSVGNPDDFVRLSLTPMERRGADWIIAGHLSAHDADGNRVEGRLGRLVLVPNGTLGPINAGADEFFLFVEEVDIPEDGTGEFVLAIARRAVETSGLEIRRGRFPPGTFGFEDPDRNRPIMPCPSG